MPKQKENRAGDQDDGLPGWQHSALELDENELPHLWRVIAVNQNLHPSLIFIGGAHRDEIGVGPLGIFAKDCVAPI